MAYIPPYLTITKLSPDYKEFGIILKDVDMRYINEQIIDGDEYRIDYYTTSQEVSLSVFRRDYTTDNENGDNGIKITLITNYTGSSNPASVTFIVEEPINVYNYEYMIDINYIGPAPTPTPTSTPTLTMTPTSSSTPTPTPTPSPTYIIQNCFNIGTGYTETFYNVEINNDKIYVGGFTDQYGDTAQIYKLNSDGSTDTGWNIGSGFDQLQIDFRVQTDGKLVVCGPFLTFNGMPSKYIARLNTNGSYDNTFNIGTSFTNTYPTNLFIQSDGKILCGGYFTGYNGTSVNGIIRLNIDGSVDTGFTSGSGFNDVVDNMYELSNNKLIMTGLFTTYNGNSSNQILRLNSDGTYDNTFNVGTGFSGASNRPNCIGELSDGTIIIGGTFTSYNGTSVNNIIKLNTDGSINTGFTATIGSGFNNSVTSMYILNDKILLGGTFTSYNGVTANRVIRLNSDGTIDLSYNIGIGFNEAVYDVNIQSTEKVILVGKFSTYQSISSHSIVRALTDGTIDNCNIPTPTPTPTKTPTSSMTPTPSNTPTIGLPTPTPTNTPTPSSTLTIPQGFVTEWTVSGDTAARTITLPLTYDRPFNCVVYWGDGTSSTITSYNDARRIHTYSANGVYQVNIVGDCPGWRFNNGGDKLKITDIISWGNNDNFGGFSYLWAGFYGCANLKSLGTGSIKVLSGFWLSAKCFQDCAKITEIPSGLLDNWGNTNDLSLLFQNCQKLTTIPSGLFDNCVNATTLENVFAYCYELTTIPSNLFDNCTGVTTFKQAFWYDEKITAIPTGLFNYNTEVTSFIGTFGICRGISVIPTGLFNNCTKATDFTEVFYFDWLISSIPSGLFDYCPNVTSFRSSFYYCPITSIPTGLFNNNTKVTTFLGTFKGTQINSIPSGLFDTCILVNNFEGTFGECYNLVTIPSGLFDACTGVTTFRGTFMSDHNITTLPDNLFKYNTLCTIFNNTFNRTYSLSLNPRIFCDNGDEGTRFLNQSIGFDSMFWRDDFYGSQGESPDLWNYNFGTGTPSRTTCFGGVGNSLTSISNYNDIPVQWK